MAYPIQTFGSAPFEIIDGDRGKAYPKQSDFRPSGYCLFLSATNVTKAGFDFGSGQFIDEQKDVQLRKGKLQREDVILTTRGTLGNVAHYSNDVPFEHVRINSGMVILRCDQSKILPRYLFAYLRSGLFRGQVERMRSGVAQPQLPIRDMKRIEIPLPTQSHQERLVEVIAAYDDLIENNRRRIALLEEAARLLYREWFVHFRYPGHEHIAVTGSIPEGWEQVRVAGKFDTTSGGTPSRKTPDFFSGHINWVKTQELNELPIFETSEKITEEAVARSSAKILPGQTLLVSIYGNTNIGRTGLLALPGSSNQACVALLPKRRREDWIYAQLWLQQHREQIAGLAQGSAQTNISQETLRGLKMIWPTSLLLDAFLDRVLSSYHQIECLCLQNSKLAQARDLLLPRLMNGEIAV